MYLLLIGLILVILLLSGGLLMKEKSAKQEARSHARERNNWQIQQNDLMDRLMVLKGHREYAPEIIQPPAIEEEITEDPWEEL